VLLMGPIRESHMTEALHTPTKEVMQTANDSDSEPEGLTLAVSLEWL
jgi:hypothetical protein